MFYLLNNKISLFLIITIVFCFNGTQVFAGNATIFPDSEQLFLPPQDPERKNIDDFNNTNSTNLPPINQQYNPSKSPQNISNDAGSVNYFWLTIILVVSALIFFVTFKWLEYKNSGSLPKKSKGLKSNLGALKELTKKITLDGAILSSMGINEDRLERFLGKKTELKEKEESAAMPQEIQKESTVEYDKKAFREELLDKIRKPQDIGATKPFASTAIKEKAFAMQPTSPQAGQNIKRETVTPAQDLTPTNTVTQQPSDAGAIQRSDKKVASPEADKNKPFTAILLDTTLDEFPNKTKDRKNKKLKSKKTSLPDKNDELILDTVIKPPQEPAPQKQLVDTYDKKAFREELLNKIKKNINGDATIEKLQSLDTPVNLEQDPTQNKPSNPFQK